MKLGRDNLNKVKTQITGSTLVSVLSVMALFQFRSVNADILAIDLNCSKNETTVEQQIANSRGEQLVIFPARTSDQEELCSQEHLLEMKSENTEDPVKLKVINDKMTEIQNKLDKNPIRFDLNDLKPVFQSMSRQGRTFESITISGHLKGSFYFGLQGKFLEGDLINVIKQYPVIQNGVRSLYGWLCYSTTRVFWWDAALPNLQIMGGFDDSSIGSENPLDSQLLIEMFERESDIQRINAEAQSPVEEKELVTLVRGEPGITVTNAAECTRSECVGMRRKINLNLLKDSCTAQAYQSTMALAPSPKDMEDPLCDTARNQKLRPYYDALRRYEFCEAEKGPYQSKFATFDGLAEKVIRKILLRQVMINFSLHDADDIKVVKGIFESCYGSGSFPDFNQPLACLPASEDHLPGGRIHFKTLVDTISKLYQAPQNCHLAGNQLSVMHDFLGKLNYTAYDISPHCVPGTWIEHVEDPKEMDDPDQQCEFIRK